MKKKNTAVETTICVCSAGCRERVADRCAVQEASAIPAKSATTQGDDARQRLSRRVREQRRRDGIGGNFH
jgi:hypothetical protein